MTKAVHNDVLDAALNWVKNNAERISCCSGSPVSYTSAITQGSDMLAINDISGPDFTGPDDDTSGRKLTVGQKANVEVSATGSAQTIHLVDSSGAGKILYTTDVSTEQVVTDGNQMTFNSWVINIEDPT
jgi:hypothetical protein